MATHDLLIYSVGYEARSGHAPEKLLAERRIGVVFETNRILSFEQNLRSAAARNDLVISEHVLDEQLSKLIKPFDSTERPSKPARIAVDVSSMTRRMMAAILSYLFDLVKRDEAEITLVYSPAAFQPPDDDPPSFFDFLPVPSCEGWTAFPERPLSVVLGLGYEVDLAIGAIEYLDPSGIWAFVPHGSDERYLVEVMTANEAFADLLAVEKWIAYRPADLSRLFFEMRSLVGALALRSRVVIVPGGPKIFSALSMLAKLELGEEVSVWRASTLGSRCRNSQASGELFEFSYSPIPTLTDGDEISEGN